LLLLLVEHLAKLIEIYPILVGSDSVVDKIGSSDMVIGVDDFVLVVGHIFVIAIDGRALDVLRYIVLHQSASCGSNGSYIIDPNLRIVRCEPCSVQHFLRFGTLLVGYQSCVVAVNSLYEWCIASLCFYLTDQAKQKQEYSYARMQRFFMIVFHLLYLYLLRSIHI